jgi:hypothetical protein
MVKKRIHSFSLWSRFGSAVLTQLILELQKLIFEAADGGDMTHPGAAKLEGSENRRTESCHCGRDSSAPDRSAA